MLRAQQTIHVPVDQPTIQSGINAAQNGDTVVVAPGVYNENIDFKGKAITVTSEKGIYDPASSPVLHGGGQGALVTFHSGESTQAVFAGFDLEGSLSTAISILAGSPTIKANYLHDNVGCAILITGTTSSPIIAENEIANTTYTTSCTPSFILGVGVFTAGSAIDVLNGGDISITGNTIHNNTSLDCGSGVIVSQAVQITLSNNRIYSNQGGCAAGFYITDVKNTVVVQNEIYNNVDALAPGQTSSGAEGGIFLGAHANYAGLFSAVVINNTVYGNTSQGLGSNAGGEQAFFFGQLASFVVENNIFQDTSHYGAVDCSEVSSNFQFSQNDIVDGSGNAASTCNIPGVSNNLKVDPQFIDPTHGDFHTQRSSPVVAAGDVNAPMIPPDDLDNRARTVCGTIDMGVYEIHPQPATVITSSNNPSVGGTSVTFTAKVPANCHVPTGTVTFLDGATVLGTVLLDASAMASLSTSALTVGSHNITVTYPGDFNFDPSTSAPFVQVVTGYPTATTLVQVTPNPAQAFQAITLSASVSSQFGTPGGTVSFLAGTTLLGTATVNAGGQAVMTTNQLGAGTYNVTAVYTATTQYASSTSPVVVEIVLGAASTTALASTPNPSAFGQTVTFTATVKGSGSISSGTVTFLDGGTTLSSVPSAASGLATFSTGSLSSGSHTITAAYSGSSNYNASTSNTVVQVVNPPPPPPDFTLQVSPTALNLGLKTSGTLSVVVTPTSSGLGSVLLNCGPLPAAASCSFSPSMMTLSTNAPQTAILTIHIAPSNAKNGSYPPPDSRAPLFLAGCLLAPGLLLGSFNRRRGLRNFCLAALLMTGVMGIGSCGYTRYPISETTYQVAVQATAQTPGSVKQQSVTVTAAR
jgi:hypothetical protein